MAERIYEIPIAKLAEIATSEPKPDDDGYDCSVCLTPISIPPGLEPTMFCDVCAQEAAVRLAEEHNRMVAVIREAVGKLTNLHCKTKRDQSRLCMAFDALYVEMK